jgi:hypothetical protein
MVDTLAIYAALLLSASAAVISGTADRQVLSAYSRAIVIGIAEDTAANRFGAPFERVLPPSP